MSMRHLARLVFTMIGLTAVIASSVAPAFADETKTAKKHKSQTTLESTAPTPAELYDAPIQLNFDPLKSVLLKSEPAVPYLPQALNKPQPTTKANREPEQPHLAPLLRESSLPDSVGDRGSFMDRHEFGIQLRDHF
jgi:hypothetical protein